MSFRIIFFLFFLWRIFDFLIIFLGKKFIPYLGFFPYKEELFAYNLPPILTSLANFDGIHYLLIANRGYQTYEQAFFPFYPILIKIFTPIFFNNGFLAGFFISNFSFLFGLYFFSRYLKNLGLKKSFILSFLFFFLLFPTSFFMGAIYTEGLFFFLFAASLYFLKKEKIFFVCLFAFFAALTRLVGLFLFLPIFFHFLNKKFQKEKTSLHANLNYFFCFLSPIFGLLTYCFYLWQTTGNPLFFFTSQPAFGANRSTSLVFLPQVYFRYLKIFFTANFNFQYFIALAELIIFTLVFLVLFLDLKEIFKKNHLKFSPFFSLSLFSFANLCLPTLTGTFSSIPRYSLFSLSFFIFLAKIKSTFIKKLIFFFFFIFHIIFLVFFAQGYFVS